MANSGWRRVLARVFPQRCPDCGRKVREQHCDVCGYGLFKQTRDEELKSR
jgi:ribosomal protein L37E